MYVTDTLSNRYISLQHPEWRFAFDAEPSQGAAARHMLLTMLLQDRPHIFAPHLPLGFGSLEKKGGQEAYWVPGE